MGSFNKCLRCLGLVPWGSLIAAIMCCAGVALFCGTGHEAISNTHEILGNARITGFSWPETKIDEIFVSFKSAIYGFATGMFLISILIFVDGVLATRAVKTDFDEGCKTSTFGVIASILLSALSYMIGIGWIVLTGMATIPVYFYSIGFSQCAFLRSDQAKAPEAVCIDFVQMGLMPPPQTDESGYGRICGSDLKAFCKSPNLNVAYQLFIIALVGAALVVLSMKHYLMCLAANFAYLKMGKKLAIYEDTKYREEMELNDIINTARSNERLTYKY